MPAATSHEDIYQTSSSLSSLTSCSPYLPDYMMFMDVQSAREFPAARASQKGKQRVRQLNSHSESQSEIRQSPAAAATAITYHQKSPHYSLRANCQSELHLEPTMVLSMSLGREAKLRGQSKRDDSDSYSASDEEETFHDNSYLFGQLETSSATSSSLSSSPTTMATANYAQHYLTIEELRSARNSCWLCGCNWQQDHVSLDCPECDGYAMSRPCPSCDGECKQIWERNITGTHDRHKASWVGQCRKTVQGKEASSMPSSAASSDSESDCHHSHHHTSTPTTNNNNNNADQQNADQQNNNNNNNNKSAKSQQHLCVCN